MLKIIPIAFSLLLFASCVQQSAYDKVEAENQALKNQIDELENGAERLYGQAKEHIKNNEFDKAEEKLKKLFDKHNETEEAQKGKVLQAQIDSERKILAEKAKFESCTTIEGYESYIAIYPKGKYAGEAYTNIKRMKIAAEQGAYERVSNSNDASTIRAFIADYPNHKSVSSLRRKLITVEVDEIFGDSKTGELPSFERTGYGYSASSSLDITNDTGCELTVRYSGSDVKMIEIPAGRSRTVNLTSGTYRIAASACGANYAGTEILQGSYTSRYYISRTGY